MLHTHWYLIYAFMMAKIFQAYAELKIFPIIFLKVIHTHTHTQIGWATFLVWEICFVQCAFAIIGIEDFLLILRI